MLFSEVAPAALIAVVLLLVLVRWIRRVRLVASERAWRPLELQRAELAYVERLFRTRSPLRLVARVDRGYRQQDGSIVLVELKTRRTNRAYFSDIIELSAQRIAVQAQTGKRVAHHAYVLIQQVPSGRKVPHRVDLLPTDDVVALAQRREAILTKASVPCCARAESLCAECVFETPCKRMPHDRYSTRQE
jgi:CRISPR-associated exonuclease Cas4